MANLTNKERLIRIETDVSYLKEAMNNHLSHHFRYTIMAFSVALGALATLATIIIKVI